MKRWVGLSIALLILTGCSSNDAAPVKEPKEQMVAKALNTPWAMERVDDTFYITERPGHIVKIEDGKVTRQNITLSEPLATASEAGLLGFVLAPDFATSNTAYAYYTYESTEGQFNRIV